MVADFSSNIGEVYVNSIMSLVHTPSPHAGQKVAEYALNAKPPTPTQKSVYAGYIDEPVTMIIVNGPCGVVNISDVLALR